MEKYPCPSNHVARMPNYFRAWLELKVVGRGRCINVHGPGQWGKWNLTNTRKTGGGAHTYHAIEFDSQQILFPLSFYA